MLTKIWQFIKRAPLRRSVALAFALFLYAHLNFQLTSDKHLVRVRVPVNLTLSPELQEQPGKSPEVSLTLKGKPGVEFVPGNVQVSVKVGPQHRQLDGSYLVKVTSKNIRITDKRFTFHSIDFPEEGHLRLNLLSRKERQVPLRAVFDGTVPNGMKLSWETIPDKVLITGPENVISKLNYIHTDRIPLGDAPDFFEINSQLVLPREVASAPASVLVRVKLIREYSNRSMRIPVSVLTAPGSNMEAALVTPLRGGVDILLKGPAAQLSSLSRDQVRVFVDAVDLNTPGRRRLPLRCVVSDPEIEAVSIVPGETEIQLTSKTSR